MIDSPIKSFRIRHHRGTLLFSFNFNLKLFMLCVSFRRLCTISAKQSHQFTVMWGRIRYSLSHWFVQRLFVLLIAHFIWISKSLTLSQCQRNTLENKRVLPHHFHNQIVDLICNWTAEKWRVWHVWHNNRIWRSYCDNCMQFIGSFAIASARIQLQFVILNRILTTCFFCTHKKKPFHRFAVRIKSIITSLHHLIYVNEYFDFFV